MNDEAADVAAPDEAGAAPADTGPRALRKTVGSTAEEVRQTLINVSEELGRLGVNQPDQDAIEVVLAECMNNVVEHAYCQRPGRKFELKLLLTADSLFCRLEDHGQAMPGLMMPAGGLLDLSPELDDLPEGGFGWFLIRQLTSDLRYARANGLNTLSFQIPLGQSE
ncbi:MAG: ATP-binding protein [Tropicimonas sp.]|uniref:ATP-binding protein n=1 Tax=Tropicimonas sp. TaxID=2067044 RepID=UPI003A84CEB8